MLGNHTHAFCVTPELEETIGRRDVAYLPAANDGLSADVLEPPAPRAGENLPLFSPLELLVIGIGERDPLTMVTGGWLARLGRLLFGVEVPRPFADRRREALRSLTIALRRRPSPDEALASALGAGVTPRQIEHLRSREKRNFGR